MKFKFGDKEDWEVLEQIRQEESPLPQEPEKPAPILTMLIQIASLALALFHLYTAFFGAYQSLIQRSIHVCLGIALAFLYQLSANRGKSLRSWLDRVLCCVVIAVSAVVCVHIVTNFKEIMAPNFRISTYEMVLAVLLILVVLEAARRAIGLAIPLLSAAAMLYALFGAWIPGAWGHNGITIPNLLTILAFSDRGIWGSVTGVSATIIATFVIFGSVLFATGGGQTFIDLANAVAGRSNGGAAKLATIASALFGTVSGSASSNVATTGAFTIPMMKRLGYRAEFAAAVECSASAGGQIMPPIMGAGAFIMADLLGMPYVGIISAALLPAVMYYYGVFLAIDCSARRYQYKGLEESDIVPLRRVLHYKNSLPVFVPIAMLILFFAQGYTAVTCASYSMLSAAVLYVLVEPKECKARLLILYKALINSAKGMLTVLSLISCAQILVCLISVTGIGVKFSNMIMSVGSERMLLVGILAMLATMLLGMGMPTVAAYVLAASVIAPALVRVGVQPVAAHFFVFYYAIFAGLTPPVCGTVYVGAAMAEANWLKTAFMSIRLSIGAFIVPFMFLFSPALLLEGTVPEILRCSISCLVGMTALAGGGMGYLVRPLGPVVRVLLIAAGVLLVSPDWITDVIGIGAFLAILLWLRMGREHAPRLPRKQPTA